MTHEFKSIIYKAYSWQNQGLSCVLVSVVSLEGSSYRRPGVRMLFCENGLSEGAVSGGCVEKEIWYQAQSVFKDNIPKMIKYDGRLRLGCEGIIHLLLEPFHISDRLYTTFNKTISKRLSFEMISYYKDQFGPNPQMGSNIKLEGQFFSFTKKNKILKEGLQFGQLMKPPFKLIIIGAEHDAVQLCKAASLLGWEIMIITAPDENKTIDYFPGATSLIAPFYDQIPSDIIDSETAIILMTHSFNKDVQYLNALITSKPAYFGLLGPAHRRERLMNELLELSPLVELSFLEILKGPTGINIGAESAEEISISILADILSVIRAQEPIALRDKKGSIHD